MAQTVTQSADQFPWRFKPGQSGNPLGRAASTKAKFDAKMAELAADYGGVSALTVSERTLLEQAAGLLLRKPSTAEDAVRIANAVARLIRVVQRGRGAVPTQKGQSLEEYLAKREGAPQQPQDEPEALSAPEAAPAEKTHHEPFAVHDEVPDEAGTDRA
jgi:hypothetical protein